MKALWMPTSQTFPKPFSLLFVLLQQGPKALCSRITSMCPLSTLLSAPDFLSWDSRFCPVFIGIFFMFYFIVWCPLYENNPLKKLMLEQKGALVQRGAAAEQEGEKGLSNNWSAGLWHRYRDKQTYFPGAWKMFGNRAISWIARLSIMLFQPLELLFPLQESEMVLWINEGSFS